MPTRNGTLFNHVLNLSRFGKQLRELFDALFEIQCCEMGTESVHSDSDFLTSVALEKLAFAARAFSEAVDALPELDKPIDYSPRATQLQYRIARQSSAWSDWIDFDGRPVRVGSWEPHNAFEFELRIKP